MHPRVHPRSQVDQSSSHNRNTRGGSPGRCPARHAAAGVAIFLCAVACSDDTASVDSSVKVDRGMDAGLDSRADARVPWVQPFDPAVCKIKPYKWLDPATMGKVLSREKQLLYSLPKAALETMLKVSDYKDAVTIKYGALVYFFRYETQDRGKRMEATAAVAFPNLPAGQKLTAPQVLWLHGTSGFSDKCAPTKKGADAALPVALMASQGYIGVAPDYVGMNGFGAASTMPHPYLVAEPTAMASLDALRAALTMTSEVAPSVTPSNKVVVWGGSQGGHATLVTLRYAPYYAPQYKILAGVALIPPVNLQGQLEEGLKSLAPTTIGAAAMLTAMARWYGNDALIKDALTDSAPYNWATKLPTLMDTECSLDEKKYNLTKVTDVFNTTFVDGVQNKQWKGLETLKCMVNENSLTTTSVKRKDDTPVLFVVSEKDTLVKPNVQQVSFDALCKESYKMDYIECSDASHTDGAIWSLPEQFAWVADRFAEKAVAGTCKRTAAACCKGSTKPPCKKTP